MNQHDVLARAKEAVSSIAIDAASPYASANVRAKLWAGAPIDAAELVDSWTARQPGSAIGATRYRWDVNHRYCQVPSYAGPVESWRAWQAAEQEALERDPFVFEERLSIPIFIAEGCEMLAELAEKADGTTASSAKHLIEEAESVFRRDLAARVLGAHASTDTFALFCLARAPRALARLWPLALALAATYADLAHRADGLVLGSRFPFHGRPLVSASAQLTTGLLALGSEFSLAARMLSFVREEQSPLGAWADADGPEDVLTTFVAADLLSRTDPSFDPGPTIEFFATTQGNPGFWRALGPEAPWLTANVGRWLEATERPFAERFGWPSVLPTNLDRKTRLPSFAYFDDLSRLFSDMPGLAEAETELAFIDLAGFRAFNNQYGQTMGDGVLAAFATELSQLPGARTIRDGGDEFLIIGAPERRHLAPDLDVLRHRWPSTFHAQFGNTTPVAPRILVKRTRARDLSSAREILGKALGEFKRRAQKPGPEGALEEAEPREAI